MSYQFVVVLNPLLNKLIIIISHQYHTLLILNHTSATIVVTLLEIRYFQIVLKNFTPLLCYTLQLQFTFTFPLTEIHQQ